MIFYFVYLFKQPNYQPHSLDRVVDCILSLKSYHDSTQESKDLSGSRKFDGSPIAYNKSNPNHKENISSPNYKETLTSPSSMKMHSHLTRSPSQQRKRWMTSEYDSMSSVDISLAMQNAGNSQPNNAVHKSPGRDSSLDDENFVPNHPQPNAGNTKSLFLERFTLFTWMCTHVNICTP